ncbi:hypothetical protein [Clostridium fallax]|uniref:Dipeptidyl peptidase IV (DPP IV) N-terminal region n=1 Tax=Clostridium fallax TaxID=1533 RepID=A0A1M4SRE5_9CLOT|nr:hypothetical protein [Clostridium fallax]SHE34800.1 hypothetical protein SAMN05443638_101141 [Clostridium fallax]SQB07938.1 dipeptidyl peptidase IV [Clostridium fallax]
MKIDKKALKNLVIWVVVALVIQNGIFVFFEKKYQKNELKVTAVKIEDKEKNRPTPKIKVSNDAEDLKFSYNGKFMTYMESGDLKLCNVENGDTKDIKSEENAKVVFYKWVGNETSFILVEKKKDQFIFYSYDAKKDEKRELLDFNMNKFQIDAKSSEDKIEDIVCSDTNIMYIKVCRGNNLSDIYMSNVMNQLSLVKSNLSCKGNIAVPPNGTSLVYKSRDNIKILNNDDDKIIKVQNPKNINIIGIDKEDNLYLAERNGDNVVKILYGSLKQNSITFSTLDMPKPCDIKEIVFNINGNIFLNDKSQNKLINLKTKEEIPYKGVLVGEYNKGMITLDNGELKIIEFKDAQA